MACPKCSESGLLSIEMRLKGAGVALFLCGSCEHHWWEWAGSHVSLHDVLLRAAA